MWILSGLLKSESQAILREYINVVPNGPGVEFSKKIENLEHAVALHFMYYNFARPHKTLANPYPRTPGMAAGISDHIWTVNEIVRLVD